MVLIIIDTLQKIREAGGDKYSYANDYEVVGKLKRLADACGVCLLLVHHTRKQQADDKFDMISGTNGLSGAADGAFLLQKEKRTDGTATLDVVGRDQQDQRLYLIKDKEHLTWTLERMETELWVEPPDPVLEAVAAFITAERPSWGGTATELAAALQVDMKPNALAMRLNVRAGKLATDYHIRYENTRTHAEKYQPDPGSSPSVTTVTAVTAFLRAGAVSKTSSRSSRLSRGAGSNVKGAYLWVEIAARQYNPNPLIFGPRRTLAGWWKGCAFPPAQRRVEKFRRGAGRPFQRAALLGEATAVAGGKAPAPPRRAHGTFAPTGRKCHSGLLHFPQEVPSPNPRPFSTTKHLKWEDFCLWREATALTAPTQEI
ncbi:AAA family ATPase [Collinsella aerofaciens]|uniref:AAA family ATPase n=1 Tax=Collinsella aerofaciens TaxID=74426 RepID=UPI00321A136B